MRKYFIILAAMLLTAGAGKIDALAGLEALTGAAGIDVVAAGEKRTATPATMTALDAPVYNVLGQPMMQQQINANSTQRIGHSLATGLYVINLQNNQNKVAVKVMVK